MSMFWKLRNRWGTLPSGRVNFSILVEEEYDNYVASCTAAPLSMQDWLGLEVTDD